MARSLRLGKLSTRSLLDIGKLYFQMHLWHDARKCYHSGLNEAVSSKDLGLIAEGLVGLGMTFAAESWLIGLNDIALSVTHLREGADADLMKKISELPLTALHLRKAEVFFQHGLRNFPHLDHYQIPAAWSALLQLGDTKDQGS